MGGVVALASVLARRLRGVGLFIAIVEENAECWHAACYMRHDEGLSELRWGGTSFELTKPRFCRSICSPPFLNTRATLRISASAEGPNTNFSRVQCTPDFTALT